MKTAHAKLSPADRAARLASALKASQPAPGRYADARNLYLNVSPTGAKSWVFLWQANGRQRELGLGSYTGAGSTTSLSLKQARLAADAARVQIAAGIDPIAAKVQARLASVTFEALLDEKLATLSKDWKAKGESIEQEDEWRRSLKNHAGKLMPMQAGRINRDDVLAVLKPIWIAKGTTAERVRYRIEKVLDLAIAKGAHAGPNPAAYAGYLAEHLGKKASKAKADSHAALPYAEVPGFMAKLLPLKGTASKGLAFTILTATRTDETRLARWSEIDLDKGLWAIPAERMKAGVEHIVPLSTTAINLLRSVPRLVGNDFVFTGKIEGSAVGATAFSDKLTDPVKKGGLGLKGRATVHGFRSTFSDWVGDETTFAKEDREFCLAHGLDAVEGAYRRATAVEKRRAIMQAWANYCEGKTSVVALQVAA
ncbi:integrase arm-type DNA-binding domain-containing protein [Mesorhizobium sp. M0293]|uniref:tyrosine-type recombinase/integrase n=1 Tax=Mesorhizobium sp. M0293 TaxID=2956930 RepID=UPI003334DB96